MWPAFQESLKFDVLKSKVPGGGTVRGVQVAVDRRGTYVGFGSNGFCYKQKLDDASAHSSQAALDALPQVTSSAVVAEIQKRVTRKNLFKWYLGGCFLVLLGQSGSPVLPFLSVALGISACFVYRWDRERRTARLFYDIDNDVILRHLVLCDAVGESLSKARALWRIDAQNQTTQSKYHAGANTLVSRSQARCAVGSISGLELNIQSWLITMGAQQLLLLPDGLLVRDGDQLFSVSYEDLDVASGSDRFVEDGPLPTDGKIVARTWRFVNKSGGPDLRFKNNSELPVLEYGELSLQAGKQYRVLLRVSNPAASAGAATALQQVAREAASSRSFAPKPSPAAPTAAAEAAVVRPVPPPVPRRSTAAPLVSQLKSETRVTRNFLGPNDSLAVGGRNIKHPLAYAETHNSGTEGSTIITSLPVGDARQATRLPYWPSYADCSPEQRACYLDWMASGRSAPDIDIGYVFIFFYGLEWRVLREGADVDLIRNEVLRLLSLYGSRSGSFRSYAAQFVIFITLAFRDAADQQELERLMDPILDCSPHAGAVLLAWYQRRGIRLPVRYAERVAPALEGAKRSVVAKRAEEELRHLFTARYRQAFGEGLLLAAAKQDLRLEYHPASNSLHRSGMKLAAVVPNVLKKWSQFKPLVAIWNQCIEDLRRAARLKGKSEGELTAEAWSALPPELRSHFDHPDRDRWDDLVGAAPQIGAFH